MAKKARAEAARLERKKQRRRERGSDRAVAAMPLSGCAADTRGWDDEAGRRLPKTAPRRSVAPGSLAVRRCCSPKRLALKDVGRA